MLFVEHGSAGGQPVTVAFRSQSCARMTRVPSSLQSAAGMQRATLVGVLSFDRQHTVSAVQFAADAHESATASEVFATVGHPVPLAHENA